MANLGNPHLNDKDEVCYCGFGKNQPQIGWHLGAVKVERVPANTYLKEGGTPFVYDEKTNTVFTGPPGSTHWGLFELHPEFENMPQGRVVGKELDWFFEPMTGTKEVEEALGAKTEQDWDLTEPTPVEPDPEERHHEVQIGNDEYGVPTIDA